MSRTRVPPAVRRIALALVAAGSLGAGAVGADDGAGAAAPPSGREAALAARGLDDVRSGDPELERIGVRELVFAGEAGTRRAIDALAGEEPGSLRARLALVAAVSASDAAEVDAVLERETRDPRFEVRALAAQGLGLGRTPAAAAALARLAASDPLPGVRAAAQRALFAIDMPEAVTARASLPRDPSSVLRTRRATLHRLRGDGGPEVAARAAESYLRGTTSGERVAGARLLARLATPGSAVLRRLVVAEYGGARPAAFVVRSLLGVRDRDTDPAETRLAAAEALVAHLRLGGIPDEERDTALRLAVGWIAHPARLGGRRVDDEARALLRAVLPDLASDPHVRAVLVDEVVGELRRHHFDDPAHGIHLLRALGEATALPALASLVDPEQVSRAVLGHVSGALRDLRRTGGETAARRLIDVARPSDIRRDGVEALAGEPWAVAGPLLCGLVDDADDGVASVAATVLLGRREPEARARLVAALLDRAWRPFEQNLLHSLCAPADDEAYALLERLLREGSADVRRALFIELSAATSPLRGPRAVALVRLAIDTPAFGIDVGTLATALSSVDGVAAVRFVRENWTKVTRPGVLLRNLQVVADASATTFALEIAAATRDGDDRMLSEIAAVLSGRAPGDPARTDPFWHRLLARGSPEMKRVAIRALTWVDHGPMAAFLVPFLMNRDEASTSRRDALLALERGGEPVAEARLWALAANRTEDEDLRIACAATLAPRASEAMRAKATDWLAECVEEPGDAVVRIAEVAGTDATPARVARLVELFRRSLDARFGARPYLRPVSPDDDERARANRVPSLATALSASRDATALDALADSLLDPRYAVYVLETRRVFAMEHAGGGGPLTSAADPVEHQVALRDPGSNPFETARAPLPAEFEATVEALVKAGPKGGVTRIVERLERARADGALARFDDLFVSWIARRIAATTRDAEPDETQSPGAFPAPSRRDGPEALDDLDRRSEAAQNAGAFAEAARLGRAALAAGARAGVLDLPPARWLDGGRTPPPSWSLRRARIDLLDAAAATATGDAARAIALFATGTAREPYDPRIFVEATRIRLAAKSDPAAALADARRALELERRQGDEPSGPATRAFAAARRAAHGPTK